VKICWRWSQNSSHPLHGFWNALYPGSWIYQGQRGEAGDADGFSSGKSGGLRVGPPRYRGQIKGFRWAAAAEEAAAAGESAAAGGATAGEAAAGEEAAILERRLLLEGPLLLEGLLLLEGPLLERPRGCWRGGCCWRGR
jgi:hypothetical protein